MPEAGRIESVSVSVGWDQPSNAVSVGGGGGND